MLTRIYGTAFFTQGRARRAPRAPRAGQARATTASSGRELGLFTFSEVSPGAAFWLPHGHERCSTRSSRSRARCGASAATARSRRRRSTTRELWKTSGHWGKYQREHVRHRRRGPRVRRQADELPRPRAPVRRCSAAPTATCPCATPSRACCTATSPRGTLHGLLRVRHFAQDDAHIFCTEEQVAGRGRAAAWSSPSRPTGCSASRCASSSRRARSSASATTRCGTAPRASSPSALDATAASSTSSTRATAPSTGRRSTCT